MKISGGLLLLLCLCQACQNAPSIPNPFNEKVKGLVFTGPGRGPLQDQMFSSMAEVGANYVAVVPEATVYRQNLKLLHDFENQWYGERKEGVLEGISRARQQGLRIMLKPHLVVSWDMNGWSRPELNVEDSLSRVSYALSARAFMATQKSKIEGNSSWRGELMTTNDDDWQVFAKGYTEYILDYARLADSLNVELFCIGTEMKRTALEKPEFWRKLIGEVRAVYNGPITYAANWDSYNSITFWDDLDFIGVDAYFPISDKQNPPEEELIEAWTGHQKSLEALVSRFKRPVLLTEWGYEDEDFVGREPWVMGRFQNSVSKPNYEAQEMAYRSMFETVWDEPWVAGVFVWRWSPQARPAPVPTYSPRQKPAAEVLKRYFK